MAILPYIIPFVPYFVEKENKYVRYHAIQGMNLLIVGIAYSIVYSVLSALIKVKSNCGFGYWGDLAASLETYCKVTPWWVTWPFGIIGVGISALCVLGIINVCNNKAKELPIVNKIKVFKD